MGGIQYGTSKATDLNGSCGCNIFGVWTERLDMFFLA